MDFNYYNILSTELSAALIVINLLVTLALEACIVFIYRRTRHGLSYSESFVFTLIMIGVLGASIMMIVQNNIVGAFALLGAFSLIRFRTILKESSDIAFVLFSLATGVAVGTGHYTLAIITVIFLGIAIYVMRRFGFGSVTDNYDFLLILRASSAFDPAVLAPVFAEYGKGHELLSAKHREGSAEYAYTIKLKKSTDVTPLSARLRALAGVTTFELLTGKSTAEY
jgi:hypothetical protein